MYLPLTICCRLCARDGRACVYPSRQSSGALNRDSDAFGFQGASKEEAPYSFPGETFRRKDSTMLERPRAALLRGSSPEGLLDPVSAPQPEQGQMNRQTPSTGDTLLLKYLTPPSPSERESPSYEDFIHLGVGQFTAEQAEQSAVTDPRWTARRSAKTRHQVETMHEETDDLAQPGGAQRAPGGHRYPAVRLSRPPSSKVANT